MDASVSEGGGSESDSASAGKITNWIQLLLWEETVANGTVAVMTSLWAPQDTEWAPTFGNPVKE